MLMCVVLLLLVAAPMLSQQTEIVPATPMPPSEAFQYAMMPFNEARQQPNDLTDADKWALGISIGRAKTACKALAPSPLPKSDTELLDMGRLCVLGQEYEPAREALVAYLTLPSAPERETAFILLARAFLGLGWITSAESQAESLMSQFPYDASIHYTIDQIVDAAEGTSAENDDVVHRLNNQQLPLILKALHGSGSLTTNDKSAIASTSVLFNDALRCASQLRADGKQKEASALISELKDIAADPKYAQSAQLPAMQSALRRYLMIGAAAPVHVLHGKAISSREPLIPRTITLSGKVTVLIPVALWAPASSDVVEKVAESFKRKANDANIYAVTSYAINTGGDDKPAAEVLQALKILRQSLPVNVPLLIVPNSELTAFALDSYPAGIVLDSDRTVRFLHNLGTSGSLRLCMKAAH